MKKRNPLMVVVVLSSATAWNELYHSTEGDLPGLTVTFSSDGFQVDGRDPQTHVPGEDMMLEFASPEQQAVQPPPTQEIQPETLSVGIII